MTSDDEVLDVLERMRGRFYGKYRGTVTQVDSQTLRIKAKVPSVLRDQESGWCTPCVPYAGKQVGFAFLPEQGAGVWIEFEGGDVSYPVWTGCYWRADELPADATPTVKTIATAQGLKLLLDDDGQTITLSDDSGNTVTLDSNGITCERGGKKVVVSDSGVDLDDGAVEVS